MSLRWNKYVVFAGHRVSAILQVRSMGQVQSMNLSDVADTRFATLETVIGSITRSKLPRLDTIQVVLGYPYTRYMILPWQDTILAPVDRHAYAEVMLGREYGMTVSDWYCKVSQERFGQAAIASAMRRDIVDELVAICQKNTLRLQSVRPVLIDTIDRYSGVLHDDAVFVVDQSDAYEFAFRRHGVWHHAFSLRGAGRTRDQCLMSASVMANHFPSHVHVRDFVLATAAPSSEQLHAAV